MILAWEVGQTIHMLGMLLVFAFFVFGMYLLWQGCFPEDLPPEDDQPEPPPCEYCKRREYN